MFRHYCVLYVSHFLLCIFHHFVYVIFPQFWIFPQFCLLVHLFSFQTYQICFTLYLLTKLCIAVVFPIVMLYACKSWTNKAGTKNIVSNCGMEKIKVWTSERSNESALRNQPLIFITGWTDAEARDFGHWMKR